MGEKNVQMATNWILKNRILENETLGKIRKARRTKFEEIKILSIEHETHQ